MIYSFHGFLGSTQQVTLDYSYYLYLVAIRNSTLGQINMALGINSKQRLKTAIGIGACLHAAPRLERVQISHLQYHHCGTST